MWKQSILCAIEHVSLCLRRVTPPKLCVATLRTFFVCVLVLPYPAFYSTSPSATT